MLKTIKVTIIPNSVGDRQKEITGKIGDLCLDRQVAAPGESVRDTETWTTTIALSNVKC